MIIDYDRIKKAFPSKAWAYAEQYDGVKIGKWNGSEFFFYQPLDEKYLLTLRIFGLNSEGINSELKFTGGKCRDSSKYESKDYIEELAGARYYLSGCGNRSSRVVEGEFTKLSEERGGVIYFPVKLDLSDGETAVKLGIKNFVRYNEVSVLPNDKEYDYGLGLNGAGALEVVDYAYTGFFRAKKTGDEELKL